MPIHAFCGGVGTAGMLMGVSGVLREAESSVRIIALEPASSAVISTGRAGTHHVEGIGIGFLPPLLQKDAYDEARGIDETEARQLARQLAKEEGIFGVDEHHGLIQFTWARVGPDGKRIRKECTCSSSYHISHQRGGG
jgi:cysteine synthase